MLRLVGGVIAGIVAWIVIVTALNLGLRHGWPAYAAVEKAMAFTVPMMVARLSMSAVSSLMHRGPRCNGDHRVQKNSSGRWVASHGSRRQAIVSPSEALAVAHV